MESWEGKNYSTQNPTKWVALMNLSTVEWGVGYLPANLVAIPGAFNDSISVPSDSIVIQHAGESKLGSRGVQKITLGIASGIVLLWAAIWLWSNWNKMFGPLRPAPAMPADDNSQTTTGTGLTTYGDSFIRAKAFEKELENFYYNGENSFPEVSEKTLGGDGVDAVDVEAAVDLLRKMYSIDLDLWAKSSSRQITEAKLNEMRLQSDAILAEVNRSVRTWDQNIRNNRTTNPTPQEQREMTEIAEIIRTLDAIGPRRYPNAQPVYEVMEPRRARQV